MSVPNQIILMILKVLAIISLNCDVSNKNIKSTNSKNLDFCINIDITNKADINNVMDENLFKIH